MSVPTSTLTYDQEKQRPESTAPFPQPWPKNDNAKQYDVRRIELAAGDSADIYAAFEPNMWLIYCRNGQATDGYYVSPTGDGTLALWQSADKWIKIPGRGNHLAIQSDASVNTLIVFVVAMNNTDVVLP